jgi:hypothetical protein
MVVRRFLFNQLMHFFMDLWGESIFGDIKIVIHLKSQPYNAASFLLHII